MIENQPNEITLIYHSDKPDDKKTRAYVETIEEYAIKTLDLKREGLTETQLAEIANKLGCPVHDLVDPEYLDQAPSTDIPSMSDADILTTINQEPILLNTPILIVGNRAYHYRSSYNIIHEAAAIIGLKDLSHANKEERKSD